MRYGIDATAMACRNMPKGNAGLCQGRGLNINMTWQPHGNEKKGQQDMDIYVGNLAYKSTDEDLRTLFAQYGEVTSARVVVSGAVRLRF